MKAYKFIPRVIALICISISLSACNNQDETMLGEQKVPLEINIKGCATRTIITNSMLPDNSQLGIFAVNKDDQIANSNMEVLYINKQCKLAEPVYLAESEKNIYAYYPYVERTELGDLFIDTRSQTDYLYGYAVNDNDQKTTVSANNPKANILLKHAMARITLNIKKTEKNTGNEAYIYGIIFAGVSLVGNFDIKSGIMKATDKGDLVISTKFPLTVQSESVDILVPPIEGTQHVMLNLNISDKYHAVWMPAGEWKAGQQYTYSVAVGNNSFSISQAEITLWNNTEKEGIEVGDNNYVE